MSSDEVETSTNMRGGNKVSENAAKILDRVKNSMGLWS